MKQTRKKLHFILLCFSICCTAFSHAASIVELDSNEEITSTVSTINEDKQEEKKDKFINVIMGKLGTKAKFHEGDNVRFIYPHALPDKQSILGVLWLYRIPHMKYISHALAGVTFPEKKVYLYKYPDLTAKTNMWDFHSYPIDKTREFANLTQLELRSLTREDTGFFIHHIRRTGTENTQTYASLELYDDETKLSTNNHFSTEVTSESTAIYTEYNNFNSTVTGTASVNSKINSSLNCDNHKPAFVIFVIVMGVCGVILIAKCVSNCYKYYKKMNNKKYTKQSIKKTILVPNTEDNIGLDNKSFAV